MSRPRVILHVDMDAFFASIEQMDCPELRGKPVLVGHAGPRGVVAAASYEARKFGCHSAQPMAIARRLCPRAVIVPGRFSRYSDISRQVFEILDAFTPLVEPVSVDEAFMDVTGTEGLFGPGVRVAELLRERIRKEIGLTASVGVAPNKYLAKLASDMNKPDGLTILGPENIDAILPPLPVERLWGVGPATAGRLHALGIKTIGDLRAADPAMLRCSLGDEADHYLRLAFGQDDRPVATDRTVKSISHEQTFGADLEDPQIVRQVLLGQVEQVARRLRRQGRKARAVALKIRFGDFQTIHRSATLDSPADETEILWRASLELFDHWVRQSYQPVRLIGMGAEQLTDSEGQLALFDDPQRGKQRQLDAVADRIVARFGNSAIARAGGMPRKTKTGFEIAED